MSGKGGWADKGGWEKLGMKWKKEEGDILEAKGRKERDQLCCWETNQDEEVISLLFKGRWWKGRGVVEEEVAGALCLGKGGVRSDSSWRGEWDEGRIS